MKLYSKNAISCLFSRNSKGTRHHENKSARKNPPAVFEPLEPRILLSADLSYGGGDTALDLDLRLDPTNSSILQLIDNTDQETIIGNLALDLSSTDPVEVEILGSSQDDRLNIDLDSPSALGLNISFLDASSEDSDTLIGPLGNSTWNITGNDSGTVGTIEFSFIEHLFGG